MCTVTWTFRAPLSYELYFNRDELRSRPRALMPAVHQAAGTAFVAATDPKGGGTWLACNEIGLSVGLLNLYGPESLADLPATEPGGHHRSRGLLVLSLADARTPSEVDRRMADLDVSAYRPFVLFCIVPNGPSHAARWSWDGSSLTSTEPDLPLTTSSFASDEVVSYRRAQFRRFGIDCLDAFHRSFDPARRAHSVFMARPDARTVSLSRLSVSPEGIRFLYWEPDADSTRFVDTADVALAPVRTN